jgi:hypothetical protein
MEQFRDAARGVKALPPEKQAGGYDFAVKGLVSGGVLKPEEVPPFTPELLEQVANYGEKPKGNEGFTLTPGQVRFGADGKQIADVPAAPKEPTPFNLGPGDVRYDGKGNVIASRPAAPKEREPKLVSVKTLDENGKTVTKFVVPKAGESYPEPTGAGKASTGQQKRALNFFNRGKEAAEIIDSLESGKKLNPTALKYVPDVANVLLSDENQAYRQAQRAFTEARLRKESGAAIKDEEYESDAVKYFNQPGDSDATKKQKRAARNAVLAGIGFESGDALKEFYGDESEGMLAGLKAGSKPEGLEPMTAHGQFSVKAPDGKTYRFSSAAELDGFKKRAGIK